MDQTSVGGPSRQRRLQPLGPRSSWVIFHEICIVPSGERSQIPLAVAFEPAQELVLRSVSGRFMSHDVAVGERSQTIKRYPMPGSVMRYRGRPTSGSSLRRSWLA